VACHEAGWLVGAILEAPAGLALLAQLEHRPWLAPDQSLAEGSSEALAGAVQSVLTMSFGTLVSAAVRAAEHLAGPSTPEAAGDLADAYRLAGRRRPIAEAIVERFGSLLTMPLTRGAQQRGRSRSLLAWMVFSAGKSAGSVERPWLAGVGLHQQPAGVDPDQRPVGPGLDPLAD
jgi:hypothetical protein